MIAPARVNRQAPPAQFAVPEGNYEVVLNLAGYQAWSSNAGVTANETTTINATLVAVGGGWDFTIYGYVDWFDNRPLTNWVVGSTRRMAVS